MNCPKCKKQMIKRNFFSFYMLFGGYLLEVLVAFLVVSVMMTGIVGRSILSVLIILLIVFCWGKRWYRCNECDYTTIKKLKSNPPTTSRAML